MRKYRGETREKEYRVRTHREGRKTRGHSPTDGAMDIKSASSKMVCTTEGSAEGWNGVADVGGLGVRVTGRPVREELVENALEEELAELEELDEL